MSIIKNYVTTIEDEDGLRGGCRQLSATVIHRSSRSSAHASLDPSPSISMNLRALLSLPLGLTSFFTNRLPNFATRHASTMAIDNAKLNGEPQLSL